MVLNLQMTHLFDTVWFIGFFYFNFTFSSKLSVLHLTYFSHVLRIKPCFIKFDKWSAQVWTISWQIFSDWFLNKLYFDKTRQRFLWDDWGFFFKSEILNYCTQFTDSKIIWSSSLKFRSIFNCIEINGNRL